MNMKIEKKVKTPELIEMNLSERGVYWTIRIFDIKWTELSDLLQIKGNPSVLLLVDENKDCRISIQLRKNEPINWKSLPEYLYIENVESKNVTSSLKLIEDRKR